MAESPLRPSGFCSLSHHYTHTAPLATDLMRLVFYSLVSFYPLFTLPPHQNNLSLPLCCGGQPREQETAGADDPGRLYLPFGQPRSSRLSRTRTMNLSISPQTKCLHKTCRELLFLPNLVNLAKYKLK